MPMPRHQSGKQEGRGRFRFFSGNRAYRFMHAHMLSAQCVSRRPRATSSALPAQDRSGLFTAGGRCRGRLVRWRRQDGSLISPAQFIPLAEKTGADRNLLGRSVLLKACQEGRRWHRAGLLDPYRGQCLPPLQLAQSNFTAMVSEIIEQTGIMPGYLELEITEGCWLGCHKYLAHHQ